MLLLGRDVRWGRQQSSIGILPVGARCVARGYRLEAYGTFSGVLRGRREYRLEAYGTVESDGNAAHLRSGRQNTLYSGDR